MKNKQAAARPITKADIEMAMTNALSNMSLTPAPVVIKLDSDKIGESTIQYVNKRNRIS